MANEEFQKRWSLQGSTALVTGGTKGIGHAIVEELARLGARVHTCSRNETELQACLQQWESMNLCVSGSVCDVSSCGEREKLIERVSSLFHGKLNILINNAALGIFKLVLDSTAEDYSSIMATNLESGLHLSQLAHPLLKASGVGSIVFISSISSLIAAPFSSVYGVAKGAINQLGRSLAFEWAKDGIRTNCVAPGPIHTPMAQLIQIPWSSCGNFKGEFREIKAVGAIQRPVAVPDEGDHEEEQSKQSHIFFAPPPRSSVAFTGVEAVFAGVGAAFAGDRSTMVIA